MSSDCMTEWPEDNDTGSNTGLHYFQVRTAEKCEKLCLRMQGCIGIEFDTRMDRLSGGCYAYFDKKTISNYRIPFAKPYRAKRRKCQYTPVVLASLPSPPPTNEAGRLQISELISFNKFILIHMVHIWENILRLFDLNTIFWPCDESFPLQCIYNHAHLILCFWNVSYIGKSS